MGYKFNCWEKQAAVVLAEYDYELADVWPFFWQSPVNGIEDPHTIGDALRSMNFDVQYAVERVLGVPIREYCFADCKQTLERIEVELDRNRGVLTFVNARFCPWSPAFELYDNSHFVLVRAIDRTTRQLRVDDLFHERKGVQLCFEALEHGHGSMFSFEFDRSRAPCTSSTRTRLMAALAASRARYGTGHAGLAERITGLVETYSYDREVRHFEADWWSSPLFAKLFKIEHAHHNISAVLRRDGFTEAETFACLAKKWETVRTLFLAASNPRMRERSIRSIASMAQKIESDACLLERCLTSGAAGDPSLGDPVDIADLRDSRWFERGDAVSDLVSELQLSRADWPTTIWIDGREIAFDVAAVNDRGPDCVTCRGQMLTIPVGRESYSIYVLYTRVSIGDGAAFALVCGERVVRHALSANTIFTIVERPTERVAWAELKHRGDGGVTPTQRMGYLYARRFALEYSTSTVRLHLPEDGHTYMFAVTVA